MATIRRSVALVFLENIVLTLSGVFLSVVFARSLGPAGLGDWKLVMSMQTYSVYFLGFGFSMLVTRYTAEFLQQRRILAIWQLLRITTMISVLAVLIAGFAYVAFFRFGSYSLDAAVFLPENTVVISLALGLNLINDVIGRSFLTGIQRRDLVAVIQICGRGLLLLGVLIAVWVEGVTIYIAAALLAAGYFVELLLYLAVLYLWRLRVGRGERDGRLVVHDKERLLRFSGFQWLFRIFQSLREYAVDNFMLLVLKGIELVGVYGAAVSAPSILRGVSPSKMLTGVILPRLVPAYTESSKLAEGRVQFFFSLIQKLTAILIWPLLTIFFILAEEFLLLLFGSGFETAATPMRILLFFLIPTMAADAFYASAVALEESKLTFYVSLWGVANVFLNLALIPNFGAAGAAISTGCIGVGIYAHFFFAMKRQGWVIAYPWVGCVRAAAAQIPLIICLLSAKFIFSTALSLPPALIFGLVGYLGVIRRFSPFKSEESVFLQRELGGVDRILIARRSEYVR